MPKKNVLMASNDLTAVPEQPLCAMQRSIAAEYVQWQLQAVTTSQQHVNRGALQWM
jgi:hypothetical protein